MLKKFVIIFLIFAHHFSYAVEIEQIDDAAVEEEQTTAENDDNFINNKAYAKIQILNKITAKIKYLDVKVNSEVVFDSLKIKVNSCWKSSPYDLSENKILLEVLEKQVSNKEYHKIFEGWMFSSSPAISSMEHPIYDVVAVNCHN